MLANEPALQETYEGIFDPDCDAYAPVPDGRHQRRGETTIMTAWKGVD